MTRMSAIHDVGMMYGKKAADVYDKLYKLTNVEWVDTPKSEVYFDKDRDCYCCGECDNPLWDMYRIHYCPYCCAEIII